MGYTTDFEGRFNLDRPLADEHRAYLTAFAETRRMRRDASRAESMEDPTRADVGLPIGTDGAYFTGGLGFMGQQRDESVVDGNNPPSGQPGLWCEWVPTGDGTAIEWNGAEKFYDYVEWLAYLVEHFLEPWGYRLTGDVRWEGEERGDVGVISVDENRISVRRHVPASQWTTEVVR